MRQMPTDLQLAVLKWNQERSHQIRFRAASIAITYDAIAPVIVAGATGQFPT